jgi:hypothetical protein
MVSPLDKNGGDVNADAIGVHAIAQAATTGDAIAYPSRAQFADIASGAWFAQYLSVRDPSTGWSTRGISPPLAPSQSINRAGVTMLSDGLTRAVVYTSATLAPGADLFPIKTWIPYLQDNTTSPLSHQLVSPPMAAIPDPGFPLGLKVVAAADDLSHLVLNASVQLTADGSPDAAGSSSNAVYVWSGGQLRFVSVLPGGTTPAANDSAFAGGVTQTNGAEILPVGDHAISDDGSRVYFTVNGRIYLRDDYSSTAVVTGSERTGDDPSVPTGSGRFELASADGSLALFRSSTRYTDDATAGAGGGSSEDLYRWDADAPLGSRLTDLTTGDPDGGGVLGVVAATDDGSRIYFAATGSLAPGAVDGQPNLYLWDDGDLRHIAVLDAADEPVWAITTGDANRFKDSRISDDGVRLLLASRAPLTAYDTAGHRQVFLYDASENATACVSCSPLASASSGDAELRPLRDVANAQGAGATLELPRNLSSDGERVVFETPERLVPGDANGRPDVYLWRDGAASLISSGRSGSDSRFLDASPDGDDVFFTTRERLVRSDTDDLVDVYDARVGGGFPDTAQPGDCQGDDCQGTHSAAPVATGPATETFDGAGDLSPGRDAMFAVLRVSARQLAAFARRGRFTLAVRLPHAGRVVVRSRSTRPVAARSGRPGVKRLTIRLAKPALKRLRRTSRLSVRLTVRFAGQHRTQTLILRRSK